jgi:hypothetical protein
MPISVLCGTPPHNRYNKIVTDRKLVKSGRMPKEGAFAGGPFFYSKLWLLLIKKLPKNGLATLSHTTFRFSHTLLLIFAIVFHQRCLIHLQFLLTIRDSNA